jgi:tRNA (guanine37-N1)-methyltransferase
MVMKPDILAAAIDSVATPSSHLIFTTPAGTRFNQQDAHKLAALESESADNNLIFVCGRFEGFDARVPQYYKAAAQRGEIAAVHQFSIGDYVLNGGEVAALAMIEAITRLIPGVIGNAESLVEESHELDEDGNELLEYPNYTRPVDFRGMKVPDVLLSGNHAEIKKWRKQHSPVVSQHETTID